MKNSKGKNGVKGSFGTDSRDDRRVKIAARDKKREEIAHRFKRWAETDSDVDFFDGQDLFGQPI